MLIYSYFCYVSADIQCPWESAALQQNMSQWTIKKIVNFVLLNNNNIDRKYQNHLHLVCLSSTTSVVFISNPISWVKLIFGYKNKPIKVRSMLESWGLGLNVACETTFFCNKVKLFKQFMKHQNVCLAFHGTILTSVLMSMWKWCSLKSASSWLNTCCLCYHFD